MCADWHRSDPRPQFAVEEGENCRVAVRRLGALSTEILRPSYTPRLCAGARTHLPGVGISPEQLGAGLVHSQSVGPPEVAVDEHGAVGAVPDTLQLGMLPQSVQYMNLGKKR